MHLDLTLRFLMKKKLFFISSNCNLFKDVILNYDVGLIQLNRAVIFDQVNYILK